MSVKDVNIIDCSQIRVLIYPADGAFCARALELDLIGYGKTEKSALEELTGLIESQLSFAAQKQDPDLVLRRADDEYFVRWEKANSEALKGVLGDQTTMVNAKAVCITFAKRKRAGLKKWRQCEPVAACG